MKAFAGDGCLARNAKLLEHFYADANGSVDFNTPRSRQNWKPAKATLKQESSDKCAYCEAQTAVVAHGDVEHFRPKSQYWWLAYSYCNYTYSCQICNQSYKGDQFPVSGDRLEAPALPKKRPASDAKLLELAETFSLDPSSLTADQIATVLNKETKHLPDPYLEDPEELFAWEAIHETSEVWIRPNGSGKKAKNAYEAAESVLGLNRVELLNARWMEFNVIYSLAVVVQEAGLPADARQRIVNTMLASARPESPFAGMKRFYLREWGFLT
ncbi:MAG: hypothetical protein SF172_04160 [Burkholderiales bacterium]|nr:hypothetical protein [Burkholderiales bacterium]